MCDDFNNPDGSMRRTFHPPPPPLPPFHPYPHPHQQQHFYHQPHPHHPQFPPRPFNARMPSNQWMPPPGDYGNNVRQTFRQVTYETQQILRGSPVPVRIPVPVQTSAPQPTPPPPVLTPQPAPLPVLPPPPPAENSEKNALVPVSIQPEEKNGKVLEKTKEPCAADAIREYNALGQALGFMQIRIDNQAEELATLKKRETELAAANEALTVQLEEKEQTIKSVNEKSEEVVKKAEKDIQQAKNEETIWRNNYVGLNEQSLEKDETIKALKKKETENETKIKDLEAKVLQFEASVKTLNEELTSVKNESKTKDEQIESLEEKVTQNEAKINSLNNKVDCSDKAFINTRKLLEEERMKLEITRRNYKSKCDEFAKLKDNFDKLNLTNKANEASVEKVKIENSYLKLDVADLEGKHLEKVNEISRISGELETEKKENQENKVVLEEKNKEIDRLKEELKLLEEAKDDFPKQWSQYWENISLKRRKLEVPNSSSSFEKESCAEPSSMQVERNEENGNGEGVCNEAEQQEGQDSFKTIGQRKFPVRKMSAVLKKRLLHDHDNSPHQSDSQRKSNTGSDTAIPEVSSSRPSISPSSSGRQQRSCTRK